MSLDNLPFNWFDLLLLIVLIVGIQRGRKHGISEELMSTIQWVAIAVGCAMLYRPIGAMISQGSVFSLLSSYLMAYIAGAMVISVIFAMLKKSLGGKLVGSDAFGRSEFYLGMLAGMVRFCCIVVTAIALLHARKYTSAEVSAGQKYQNEVYGSNFFPTLHTIQAQVFEKSLAGPWISSQLGFLLIEPTAPEQKQLKRKEFAAP